MKALKIADDSIRLLLLHTLMEVIETDMDTLLRCGISAIFIDSLRGRPARDIQRIAKSVDMSFIFDERSLANALGQLDRFRERDVLLEYFIRNGAPASMMRELFNISRAEVRNLRALIPLDSSLCGAMPSALKTRDAIHAHWHRLVHEDMPGAAYRDMLYALHQAWPGYSIAALYHVLVEFGDGADGGTPHWAASELAVPSSPSTR